MYLPPLGGESQVSALAEADFVDAAQQSLRLCWGDPRSLDPVGTEM